MLLRWVKNITIVGSVFTGNGTDGIHLLNAENIRLEGNKYLNDHNGVLAVSVRGLSVEKERADNCERGYFLLSIRPMEINGTTFLDNDVGIQLFNSHFGNVTGSVFRGNRIGLLIHSHNSNVITSFNQFERNEIGISIGEMREYYFNGHLEHHHNSFINESGYAIAFRGARDQNIHNNTMAGCGILYDYIFTTGPGDLFISGSNLVNGLPVLFWKDRSDENITGRYGQIILRNCLRVNISNMEFIDRSIGVQMIDVEDIRITNCTIRDMGGPGVTMIYSYQVIFDMCVIENCQEGIRSIQSTFDLNHCIIIGNRGNGLYLMSNRYYPNSISNCNISFNEENGIFGDVGVLYLANTTCSNNGEAGLYLYPGNYEIRDSIFSSNRDGILINGEYRDYPDYMILIVNNSCSYNGRYGIFAISAWGVIFTIVGNVLVNNSMTGVEGFLSIIDLFEGNLIIGGERSSSFYGSVYEIRNNTFIDFTESGLFLRRTSSVIRSNTFFSENGAAMDIFSDRSQHIQGNDMTGCGIRLNGMYVESYRHKIDQSNTVNGRPILYLSDKRGMDISGQYGQVILVNCSDLLIYDMALERCTDGLLLFQCDNIRVVNVTLRDMDRGLILKGSSDCIIVGSETSGCHTSGLMINSTSLGIYVYHNNFIENKVHVVDDSNDTVYHDMVELGNYWDDYREKVPGDVKPLTMVWDTPYPIKENSTHRDNFPLIFPYGTTDLSDPRFIQDLTPKSIMFGDTIDFRVIVSDDLMVSRVLLKYWSEGEGFFSEDMALIGKNMWAFSTVWDEPYDPVYYWFRAYDTFGNHTQTDDGCIEVMDLLPWFGPDETYGTGTTGDIFQFKIPVFDDLGVVEVSVRYWFEGVDPIELPLEDLVAYLRYLKLPTDSCGEMMYRFRAVDSSSNSNITPTFSVNIDDNDLPVADAGPDIRSLEGIWIRLDGSRSFDNIGITSWRWICNVNGAEVFLFGADPEMFFREAGDYTIELIVEDGYGNSASDVILVRIDARPQPVMLNIRVGPVIDVEGNPLEGVLIELEVNGTVLTCVTDGSGWGEMTILASAIQGRVNVRMNKEGYREAFYITHLNSNADLADDPPSMKLLPEDAEDESDDIGRAISVTLILFLFLSLSALIAVIGWVRRLKEDPEQAMLDE